MFNAIADNSSTVKDKSLKPANLTLSASYSNGINRHENIVSNLNIQSVEENKNGNSSIVVAGLLFVVVAAGGTVVYRKKKQDKK